MVAYVCGEIMARLVIRRFTHGKERDIGGALKGVDPGGPIGGNGSGMPNGNESGGARMIFRVV